MQLIDGSPVYSATDLVGFLACQHLTALDLGVLDGTVGLPWTHDAELEVLQKRGFEHERSYRETLEGEGKRVVEIRPDDSIEDYATRIADAARATEQAMADGLDVIYQGAFFGDGWRGHPDFLLRVDDPVRPSRFGPFHYEVADTKLARAAKAGAVLQICSYVDQLERVQEVRPERLHVVLGGSARRTETLRVDDFMAYYRNVKARFQAALADPIQLRSMLPIAPDPVDHCRVCRWSERCDTHRHSVDHLSLVANISARQRVALLGRGITTLAALGSADIPFYPPLEGTKPAAAERVHKQARIQLDGRNAGKVLHEMLLPVEADKGLSCLPAPSTGDLFFDIEGDPYAFEDGLDYLFGVLEPSRCDGDERPAFHPIWSRGLDGEFSLEGEKLAFERLIDLIMDRLKADPDLHVYHYAPYEPTALKRLMGRYGTREDEVDRLLRGGVLVDLYRAVRQGLRASVESYSIKKLEPLYGYAREVELRDATSSIVAFEHWLQIGSADRPGEDDLDRILAYNRDDVVSTWQLRDWLEVKRSDLLAKGVEVPRPGAREPAPSEELSANLRRVAALEERLLVGVPVDAADRTAEQHARWLLAQLLSWHRREEKSGWWLYFHLLNDLTDEERIDAREALGGLEFEGVLQEVARSVIYRYRFSEQDYDLEVGEKVDDPATKKSAGEVYGIDQANRFVDLKRGKMSKAPHPASLVPNRHIGSQVLQDSLLRLGEWVAENGIEGDGRYRSARDLLLRAAPRVRGDQTGGPLQRHGDVMPDAAVRLGLALDQTVLPIQGPPGSGKTFIGAQMILALIARGLRVGVTANSHKVIGNLLDAVCRAAADAGSEVRGVQRAEEGQAFEHPWIKRVGNDGLLTALRNGGANLAAGTAWLWSRPEMAESVDVLFVDEAGQMSLASALAVAPAAHSMVLLGDPQQLDQPMQGVHPPRVAVSALGHLLGDDATMPPDRGLFLEETWRLHPDLCRFTSAAFYEDRLTSRDGLSQQSIRSGDAMSSGAGSRVVYVRHAGNSNDSTEEATVTANLVRQLVEGGSTWIDPHGLERPLAWKDVLVVAAYNAQVAEIRRLLPPEARVGTVDKFQGQEAPISIYSMASSSATDAPRGMTFLYNRHRLNVATSRARCVAVLVCSPDLQGVQAHTVEEMRLANALCQFGEFAQISAVEPVAARP